MRSNTSGNHHRMIFDSFGEYVAMNADGKHYVDPHLSGKFGGAKDLNGIIDVARKGLPKDGVQAIDIAEDKVRQIDKDLISQQFQFEYAIEGGDVDVARYLSGEPENMVNYFLADDVRSQPVVTLVIEVGVPCGVSQATVREHGYALMSLVEAIERTGLRAEIWADHFSHSFDARTTARQSILLKEAGDPFDAGMFMFVLTHDGMCRGLGFNTFHYYPETFRRALGAGEFYGVYREGTDHKLSDYPEDAIYIPAPRYGSNPDRLVQKTLRKLGLID